MLGAGWPNHKCQSLNLASTSVVDRKALRLDETVGKK